MLHHKISKEFHLGYFSESSQDILDFLTVPEFLQSDCLKKKKLVILKFFFSVKFPMCEIKIFF